MRVPVVLILVAVGCGPSNAFHVDDAFTPAERAALQDAVDDMAARTGGDPLVLVFDGDTAGTAIVKSAPPADYCPEKVGCYHMSSRSGDRAIWIVPGLTIARFRAVAEHEIGHSYGLDHHDAPGLMDPTASAPWDDADVAVCRRVELCR